MDQLTDQKRRGRGRHIKLSWSHLALLAIVALAAFLRFWQLDTLPPGLAHDEAYNGLDALSVLEGQQFPIFHEGWELYAIEAHEDRPVYQARFPVFFEGNYGREPLYIYLTAVVTSLIGATPTTVRLISALSGVLAVITTFLVAKILSQESIQHRGTLTPSNNYLMIPLIAALVVAILFPAITLSRLGIRAMLLVPIEALAVYAFWRGVGATYRQPITESLLQRVETSPLPLGTFKPKWFVISGLTAGLALYTYAAGRFLPLLFIFFIVYWVIRDRGVFRSQWANLGVMLFTYVIVAVPLVVFMIRFPYYSIYRSRFVANRGEATFPGQPWKTWILNIGRVLRGLVWQGDGDLKRNLPGRAYLDPLQAFIAIFGIISMISRRPPLRDVFIMMWLGIMLMPSILSGDAPHFTRMVGIVPPLAIVIAMGFVWLVQSLTRLSPENDTYLQRLGLFLVLAVMAVSVSLTVRDYFDRYANHSELSEVFKLSDWQIGKFAATLPIETTLYLTPTQEQMATIYFALINQRDRLRTYYSPEQSLVPIGHAGRPTTYLIRPWAETALSGLLTNFPGSQVDRSYPGFVVLPVLQPVPEGLLLPDMSATWGGAIALRDWQASQIGDELHIRLLWQALVEMSRSYTVYVHLLASDGSLVAQLDRLPDGYLTSDWQPGEYVVDTFHIPLPPGLPSGKYTLQTGIYHLPTDDRLGEPIVIGQVDLE